MSRLSPVTWLIGAALFFIVAADLVVMQTKVLYGGDEIISYLCATGNAGAYEAVLHQQYPYCHIVSADEYKRFFEINQPYCFKRIAADLCLNDLHPPLYFWLLHLFVLKLGISVSTGILLNLLIQVITCFVLFWFALSILNNRTMAALAVLLWALSPASMGIAFNARPYQLLELICILYVFNFYSWYLSPGRLNVMLMVFLGAAGLLTHYSFLFVIGACGLFALLKYKTTGWRNLFVLAGTALLAFEVMTLIHPCYADSFVLQQARKQAFNLHEIPFRFGKSVLGFVHFFVPVLWANYNWFIGYGLVYTISAVVIAVGAALVLRKQIMEGFSAISRIRWFENNGQGFSVTLLLLLSCAILLPYLFFVTPVHAMGKQYLVYLYPLFAVVSAHLISQCPKILRMMLPFSLIMGSAAVLMSVHLTNRSYAYMIETVQNHELVVTNIMDRRAFPRLIPYLRREQKVLMDERATYANDSLMMKLIEQRPFVVLYSNAATQNGMRYGVNCHYRVQTGDGVTFNMATIKRDPVDIVLPGPTP